MKKFMFIVTCIALCGFAASCSNTLDGAGRDIERAGEKIQDTF